MPLTWVEQDLTLVIFVSPAAPQSVDSTRRDGSRRPGDAPARFGAVLLRVSGTHRHRNGLE